MIEHQHLQTMDVAPSKANVDEPLTCADPLDVFRSGLHEVDRRNIRNVLAIRLQQQVQGNSTLPQLAVKQDIDT